MFWDIMFLRFFNIKKRKSKPQPNIIHNSNPDSKLVTL